MNIEMDAFLRSSEIIDYEHPSVVSVASHLASGLSGDLDVSRRCFEFVRDEIFHCIDYDMNPVTCRASEVLLHRTGFCFAKSHLLVALLRANGIPAGLCYQRTVVDRKIPRFALHGLAAAYLGEYGWYRIDPRGNKPGVDAQFMPPVEKLAFACGFPGEVIFPGIFAEPLPELVSFLGKYTDYRKAADDLIDIGEIG